MQVDERCRKLIKEGVTERDITRSIVSNDDTYSLGPSRSVYKCGLQFHHRMRMAELLLGEGQLKSGETLSTVLQCLGF